MKVIYVIAPIMMVFGWLMLRLYFLETRILDRLHMIDPGEYWRLHILRCGCTAWKQRGSVRRRQRIGGRVQPLILLSRY